MLHNWCFSTTNPVIEFKIIKFSVEVFTDTNRYDIDHDKYSVKIDENSCSFFANGLTSAGGQILNEGNVSGDVSYNNGIYTFNVRAQHTENIRRIKIVLYNEPFGELIAKRRYVTHYDEVGKILRYPNGWDDLFTPLVVLKNNKQIRYYRSLDNVVRPKTFVFFKTGNASKVELVFEQDARKLSKEITVPTWEFGDVDSVDEIYEKHSRFVSDIYGFEKWEDRHDVPNWAKEISLIINMHGMHWSGYIFSDYKEMERKLEYFSKYINPRHTLVYIPGFDGRYYYKYPEYTPDNRMGGIDGFKHLINRAHELGYHVMPMFMINGANPKTPGFSKWGKNSRYHLSNGYVTSVTSCDWDTSRAYDLGCGIGMNPGSKKWQKRFVSEVKKQLKNAEFDGIFLDLAAIYNNDPYFSTHEGVISIIKELHKIKPDLLVATEGWYDALTPYFPLSQCAGEEKKFGEMVYHDTPCASFFDTYARAFGHLCLGDLIDGSNGVFEWGFNPAEHLLPVRKGLIQTMTVVEKLPDENNQEFKMLLNNIKEYETKFFKK